jgi:hypothetical protein
MKTFSFVALALLPTLLSAAPAPSEPSLDVDVLVYGGTSAGVIAAYTARMYGKSVLLIEPGRHLGGLSSGGLGYTDIGNKYAVSGLGLDFYRRVGRAYGQFEAWQFEPHVAEQVFEDYVDRAAVEILYSRRVTSVAKDGPRITSVTLEYAGTGPGRSPDLTVRAREYIDASYEGDLMARAGVSYAIGREPNAQYGESYNGVELRDKHQFPDGVDPYRVSGVPGSGLLPEITGVGVEPRGTGGRGVQAYNYRMALCQGPSRLPIQRPVGYDSSRYELLLRLMEKRPWSGIAAGFKIDRMPNGKTDWNNQGAFSTDYIGGSWEYPEADYARRAEIRAEHERYQKGLLYFVGHDGRVAEKLRNEMLGWGYCADEFLDTGGWPHQLYVREARRMVGEYVMTQKNVEAREVVPDGVAMAAYGMDSHNVERVVVNGMVKNEGDVQVGGFAPYPVSYRALTPKRAQASNLLVPVALSASHIAYGSIRMEPVFMGLGQAAAVAAVMAMDAGVPVQGVDVSALQRELRENPLADHSVPEVLVDDADSARVRVTGSWETVKAGGQYGPSLLRGGQAGGSVRFLPALPSPGHYTVYLYWPRNAELSRDVKVAIRHARGTDTVTVDMRTPTDAAQGGIAQWHRLGDFDFQEGQSAWVELHPGKDGGVVLADAVLLVPERRVR